MCVYVRLMSSDVVPIDAVAKGVLLGPTIRAQTSVFLILVLGLTPMATPVARTDAIAAATLTSIARA